MIAIALVFVACALIPDVVRLAAKQRARPAPERNFVRATFGALFLVLVIGVWSYAQPGYPYDTILLIAGGISLVYLIVGAVNCRGMQFDPMSAIWAAAGLGVCGWLLLS